MLRSSPDRIFRRLDTEEMMKLDIYNLQNDKVGEVEVSETVFGAEVKQHLHHAVVRYQLAKKRAGTHASLTRGEVSGSTRKLFKQKGTGRARHGSIKAPIFVGGGVVFGPTPRDHSHKLPRKVRRGALRSALSQKVEEGKLKVVDAFALPAPKTKALVQHLTQLGVSRALVIDIDNETLKLSIRNLPTSKFLKTGGINVRDIVHYDHVVITEAAIREIDGVLKS
jgi:large subunit ribosomal protein L4